MPFQQSFIENNVLLGRRLAYTGNEKPPYATYVKFHFSTWHMGSMSHFLFLLTNEESCLSRLAMAQSHMPTKFLQKETGLNNVIINKEIILIWSTYQFVKKKCFPNSDYIGIISYMASNLKVFPKARWYIIYILCHIRKIILYDM